MDVPDTMSQILNFHEKNYFLLLRNVMNKKFVDGLFYQYINDYPDEYSANPEDVLRFTV